LQADSIDSGRFVASRKLAIQPQVVIANALIDPGGLLDFSSIVKVSRHYQPITAILYTTRSDGPAVIAKSNMHPTSGSTSGWQQL
jgi:hypothetical protein